MGGVYGKKKRYSVDREPPVHPCVKDGKCMKGKAHTILHQNCPDRVNTGPSPFPTYTPQTHCLVGHKDDDLIKPKKLLNPVKESKSHQELHHELMHASKSVEIKPELQRVLESRRRDQLIKQRKQEEDAHRKLSPLEAELLRRHRKLEELEKQLQEEQQENLRAPEFIKVKENLRRTSFQNDQKED
ncbi:protein FAM107B-like [Takifugu flavidus]|uniref:protein FAM107B-like n=1 Tax=Takifugu flavidus TaxID=433684 RepID=UPI00254456A6|nr:protein FAM107B-like [Takifugu flavidus]